MGLSYIFMDRLQGLTTNEAEQNLLKFGVNEVPPPKSDFAKKLAKLILSPIAFMLLAAAILSLITNRVFDFYFIISLIFLNGFISYWNQHKADDSIKKLQKKLIINVKVLRDGTWMQIPSSKLVPEDIFKIETGDLISADALLIDTNNFSVDESVITGESLPKEKINKEAVYAGSFVASGFAIARVEKTGGNTTYGKAIISIEKSVKRSLLERNILKITYLLSSVSLFAVLVLTILLLRNNLPFTEVLRLDLSLLIAGVPVSLPTVMTIIIALGISQLAEKDVIIRKLAALENLSNVNLLFTDKTGTLTQNKISVENVFAIDGFTESEIIQLAKTTIDEESRSPIELAILHKFQEMGLKNNLQRLSLIPADSARKRATATINYNGKKIIISLGAPQIISNFCNLTSKQRSIYEEQLKHSAENGYRTILLAVGKNLNKEENMQMAGMLFLSDKVIPGSAEVIDYLAKQGIDVKMLTGDNIAISQRVAKELDLRGRIVPRTELSDLSFDGLKKDWWHNKAGFAEILPDDKYSLVQAAKRNFIVAVTGDGINDLPATAEADVGIAVSNAVDALKGSADIVILSSGISVIKDALLESRKIFERLYSYAVYRISESLRLILTIAFLGFVVHYYPLTPIQLLLIAFLNDLPIITLAYNRVNISDRPPTSRSKYQFIRGFLHGTIGIINSLLMFFILTSLLHLPNALVQTAYFLKLTIGGHLLIYVAHTDKKWYKFLPSSPVIIATSITQLLATLFCAFGIFMTKIPVGLIILVWVWAFFWMQVSDNLKVFIKQR